MTSSSNLAIWRYSIEPRAKKYIKGYGFLSFASRYKKHLLHAGLGTLKTTSEKVVHKTSEFLGNKIAEALTNLYGNKFMKSKSVEEITIPPEKREETLKELRQVL